jgi:hypothetical protein
VLSQRRKALEVQVRQIEAEQDHPSKALQLRSLQEQLLQVTGEEDAVRQEVPESSKGLFGWTGFISVSVLYVTDRARKGNNFSGDLRDQGVEYGSSLVTLGTDSAERADMISGARNLPQRTHISPPTFQQLNGMPALLTFIKSNVTDHQGRTRRVLLFVHRYNASFNDALTATARISSEVQFPVIPVAYSWPSDGTYTGYWHDEDTVRASSQRFMKFLREFLKNSPSEVTIVCHSMGAREVTSALVEFGRLGRHLVHARAKLLVGKGDDRLIVGSALRAVGVEFSDDGLARVTLHVEAQEGKLVGPSTVTGQSRTPS